MEGFIASAQRQFKMYQSLGEKAMAQMEDEYLFWQGNDDGNSICNIVLHLHGNMMSRWTDFKTTDGEKEWRNRDGEFTPTTMTRDEMMAKWHEGWQCLYNALNQIKDDELQHIIYIRNDGHTILEAVCRQIAHYSYHVGQIVFLAKLFSNKAPWQSLSIARNASQDYNQTKFNQPKEKRDFTEGLL